MADSCGSSSSATGGVNADPNVISYADCVEAPCDCVVLTGGVRTAASPTTVSAAFVIGPGATVDALDAPAWALATVVGSELRVTGTAPVGVATLVYEIRNECSQECLVIKLTVTGACVPPTNIVRDIGYSNDSFVIDVSVSIPDGGTLVNGNIPAANYATYAQDLTITAALQQPLPTTYLINMTTPCGPYTISGNLVECRVPRLDRVTGGSVFEVGVPYTMSWVIAATGNLAIASQEGVPLGGVLSIAQNTPGIGFATVTLVGTPTENTGAGEIKFTVLGQCGSITQVRRFSQLPCRTLLVVGETGNNQFVFDGTTPVNYCKIVRGYEPTVAEFTGLPLGLSVTVAPAATAGDWLVCVTGVPRIDPCVEPEEDKICKCVDVKLKNECGNTDIKLCYNLDLASFVPKPTYCIGVFDYDGLTKIARVWGVIPFSTATVFVQDPLNTITPQVSIVTDSTGFGQVVLPAAIVNYGFNHCVSVKHSACAFVQKTSTPIYCVTTFPVGVSGCVTI